MLSRFFFRRSPLNLALFFFMFAVIGVACCSMVRQENPVSARLVQERRNAEINSWLRSTVAFVPQTEPGVDSYGLPTCSGFFVGPRRLVSAAHCFQRGVILSFPNGTTRYIPIMENVEGKTVYFMRYGEIDTLRNQLIAPPSVGVINYHSVGNDMVIIDLADNQVASEFYFDLADSAPNVGDRTFSVGHPNQLSWTLADGMVSRVVTGRVNTLPIVIQATNPTVGGCSGGPLLNEDGEVIGMTEANMGLVPELGIFSSAAIIRSVLQTTRARDIVRSILSEESSTATPDTRVPQGPSRTTDSGTPSPGTQ